jgi:hypothetical protein
MAHKPLSLGKIADFERTLEEARSFRQSYSNSLFKLYEKAHSLQGEEILISGHLQNIGGAFVQASDKQAKVEDLQVIIKYADIIDWDEHDTTPLPYLYIIAWSPLHDQTITAMVTDSGIRISPIV